MQQYTGCGRIRVKNDLYRLELFHRQFGPRVYHRQITLCIETQMLLNLFRAVFLYNGNRCKNQNARMTRLMGPFWLCDFAKCHSDDGPFGLLTNIHSSGLFSIALLRWETMCLFRSSVLFVIYLLIHFPSTYIVESFQLVVLLSSGAWY